MLDKLDGYRAVRFTWKASGKQDVGVIAQEVYEVFPEVVVTGDEKETVTEGDEAWGVNYEKLGALALEAVKELKAANDNLRSELNAANDNYAADIDALRAIVEEQGRQIERLKAGAP
ncbi:MAG: tail fiber domain-containing protein [Hyphomicrobium sp.]|nr:tail fiber domain-containing protein [Hyphomicrobium sp.]